jgi:hypothetical protein
LNESFSVVATGTNLGKETVVLPIGDFPSALRVEAKVDMIVTLSFYGTKVTLANKITEWRVQDFRPVKITELLQVQGPGGTINNSKTKELVGSLVNGTGRGLLPKFTIVGDLTSEDK